MTRPGSISDSDKKTMLEVRIKRRLEGISPFTPTASIATICFRGEGLNEELVHLIDVVTTNKTDFFREPRHFEFPDCHGAT